MTIQKIFKGLDSEELAINRIEKNKEKFWILGINYINNGCIVEYKKLRKVY